jgi:hypothetical protein
MEVRTAAGRVLTARFRAGETVAALSPSRMAVVMPAYGLDRAVPAVTADLAELAALDRVDVTVGRVPFGDDADATVRSLGGTSVGS